MAPIKYTKFRIARLISEPLLMTCSPTLQVRAEPLVARQHHLVEKTLGVARVSRRGPEVRHDDCEVVELPLEETLRDLPMGHQHITLSRPKIREPLPDYVHSLLKALLRLEQAASAISWIQRIRVCTPLVVQLRQLVRRWVRGGIFLNPIAESYELCLQIFANLDQSRLCVPAMPEIHVNELRHDGSVVAQVRIRRVPLVDPRLHAYDSRGLLQNQVAKCCDERLDRPAKRRREEPRNWKILGQYIVEVPLQLDGSFLANIVEQAIPGHVFYLPHKAATAALSVGTTKLVDISDVLVAALEAGRRIELPIDAVIVFD
mmetsp:Transcript_13256/g.35501  ORF Transcript_13256/g.35501 Transcript_13256/m.35501 type:complete len:317 (+) Transcript_13256:66-1016(+)